MRAKNEVLRDRLLVAASYDSHTYCRDSVLVKSFHKKKRPPVRRPVNHSLTFARKLSAVGTSLLASCSAIHFSMADCRQTTLDVRCFPKRVRVGKRPSVSRRSISVAERQMTSHTCLLLRNLSIARTPLWGGRAASRFHPRATTLIRMFFGKNQGRTASATIRRRTVPLAVPQWSLAPTLLDGDAPASRRGGGPCHRSS